MTDYINSTTIIMALVFWIIPGICLLIGLIRMIKSFLKSPKPMSHREYKALNIKEEGFILTLEAPPGVNLYHAYSNIYMIKNPPGVFVHLGRVSAQKGNIAQVRLMGTWSTTDHSTHQGTVLDVYYKKRVLSLGIGETFPITERRNPRRQPWYIVPITPDSHVVKVLEIHPPK